MRDHYGFPTRAIVGGVAVAIAAVTLFLAFFQTTSTDPGYVTVVRNGGPLDNRDIRQIVPPASGLTWTGWWSSERSYPTTERYLNVVPGEVGDPNAGDGLDVDAYRADSKDGVSVGPTGQWKFVVNTDAEALKEFDTKYGARDYAVPGRTDERLRPSDGNDGFATFLAQQVKPVNQEVMRGVLGDYTCAQLAAKCALLVQGNQTPEQIAAAQAALATAPSNSQVFTDISTAISDRATKRINDLLGGPYFTDVRFVLSGITLPGTVNAAIEKAQTAFAGTAQANADAARAVAEAEGRRQTAAKDADAQVERQRGYNSCGTCAEVDKIKAQGDALRNLPSGIQVYAPGNGDALQIPVR